MKRAVLLLLLLAVLFITASSAKKQRPKNGRPVCRIFKTKKGVIVKRCKRLAGATTERTCTVVRKVGRKTTVCCNGKLRILNKKKHVHCKKVRTCQHVQFKLVGKKRVVVCKNPKQTLKCYVKLPKPVKPKITGPKKCKKGEQLNVKKIGNTVVRSCTHPPIVPVKPGVTATPRTVKPDPEVVCHSTGDPHFSAFDKKYTNFYGVGDYILAKDATGVVQIVARQALTKTWGPHSTNQAVAAIVNGVDMFSYQGKTKSFKINKKSVTLKVGQTIVFKNGGSVKRTSENGWELHTVNNIRLVANQAGTVPNYYINLSLFAPKSRAETMVGQCGAGKNHVRQLVDGFFSTSRIGEVIEAPVKTNFPQKKINEATRFCAKRCKSVFSRKACVTDTLTGGKAFGAKVCGVVAKGKKFIKKIDKKRKAQVKVVRKAIVKKIAKVAKKAKKAAKKALKKAKRAAKKAAKKAKKVVARAKKAVKRARKAAKKVAKKSVRSLKKAAKKHHHHHHHHRGHHHHHHKKHHHHHHHHKKHHHGHHHRHHKKHHHHHHKKHHHHHHKKQTVRRK